MTNLIPRIRIPHVLKPVFGTIQKRLEGSVEAQILKLALCGTLRVMSGQGAAKNGDLRLQLASPGLKNGNRKILTIGFKPVKLVGQSDSLLKCGFLELAAMHDGRGRGHDVDRRSIVQIVERLHAGADCGLFCRQLSGTGGNLQRGGKIDGLGRSELRRLNGGREKRSALARRLREFNQLSVKLILSFRVFLEHPEGWGIGVRIHDIRSLEVSGGNLGKLLSGAIAALSRRNDCRVNAAAAAQNPRTGNLSLELSGKTAVHRGHLKSRLMQKLIQTSRRILNGIGKIRRRRWSGRRVIVGSRRGCVLSIRLINRLGSRSVDSRRIKEINGCGHGSLLKRESS